MTGRPPGRQPGAASSCLRGRPVGRQSRLPRAAPRRPPERDPLEPPPDGRALRAAASAARADAAALRSARGCATRSASARCRRARAMPPELVAAAARATLPERVALAARREPLEPLVPRSARRAPDGARARCRSVRSRRLDACRSVPGGAACSRRSRDRRLSAPAEGAGRRRRRARAAALSVGAARTTAPCAGLCRGEAARPSDGRPRPAAGRAAPAESSLLLGVRLGAARRSAPRRRPPAAGRSRASTGAGIVVLLSTASSRTKSPGVCAPADRRAARRRRPQRCARRGWAAGRRESADAQRARVDPVDAARVAGATSRPPRSPLAHDVPGVRAPSRPRGTAWPLSCRPSRPRAVTGRSRQPSGHQPT